MNEAGLSRLWTKIKASQVETLRPLFEAESFGPASRVSFSADYGGLPLRSCRVTIRPVQDGEGAPSPENIRRISGWTGLRLHVSPTADAGDGRTVAADWSAEAGTVYGGTLDLPSGTLTVDRLGKVFVGTESWAQSGSAASMFFRHTDSRGTSDAGAVRASSHFPNAIVLSSTTDVGYYVYTSGSQQTTRIQIRPGLEGVTSLEDWKTWLVGQADEGTPLTCWWQIETPIVCRITPQMVTALAGENHIWSDAGDVTVEYGAFLQALQQEIELLFNANQS